MKGQIEKVGRASLRTCSERPSGPVAWLEKWESALRNSAAVMSLKLKEGKSALIDEREGHWGGAEGGWEAEIKKSFRFC